MKKWISVLFMITVLIAISTVMTTTAYADVPNVVISGPETEESSNGETAMTDAWYSVNGYPSWDDIVAIGDENRVKGPSADSYLREYKLKYINAPKGNHAYVYRALGSTNNPEMIEHGARVYVLAENGNASFVIYRTLENKPQSGWVNSGILSDSYPGYLVSAGSESEGTGVNIGDPSTTWSGEKMIGTNCEYLLVDEPVQNCVGFTLEYRAQYGGYEDCSGTRNIYINDGEGWKYIGSFPYETAKSYHIVVNLDEPTSLYAVATPLKVEREKKFSVRTCVLDVMIEKTTIYIVDLGDFPALEAHKRIATVNRTINIGGGDCTYFELQKPIENCAFLDIPMIIQGTDTSRHYDDIIWASAFRDADTGRWIMTNTYEYVDGEYNSAILDMPEPVTIDAFSVFPYESPNGYGSFMVGYNTNMIAGFLSQDDAAIFVDSIH